LTNRSPRNIDIRNNPYIFPKSLSPTHSTITIKVIVKSAPCPRPLNTAARYKNKNVLPADAHTRKLPIVIKKIEMGINRAGVYSAKWKAMGPIINLPM
jgi:hypothetical protein